ncbi:MAG: SAM-dependent chlorinase/fluorinase [Alphaproteobacteria bacterium]|nr:SAM-dependent chlorinase/fluorinase [Alphaproteobacteria bacterium]
MNLFTVSSDLGSNNYYTAVIKSKIQALFTDYTVENLNHESNYSLAQTVYLFKSALMHYPANSIHLILKQNFREYLFFYFENKSVVCPNNGFITQFFNREEFKTWAIKLHQQKNFLDVVEWLIKILKQSALNPPNPPKLLPETNDYLKLFPKRIGSFNVTNFEVEALHIDFNGHVIFNLTVDDFTNIVKNNPFEIEVISNHIIKKIFEDYYAAPNDQIFAWFNPSGYLELGLKSGNFAVLFNFAIPYQNSEALAQHAFKNLKIKIRLNTQQHYTNSLNKLASELK